ncbi:hypothetical protein [Thermogymnomonas acidicola]|uniref:hypothetical protein n=1 Tax=Thermogymnomonas acidicola TaxID=399579 RepID=UPI0009467534|nr:hypothetical protein [Thermogymnomonas acidicola]
MQFNRVYGGIWDSRSASFVEEYTEEFVSVTTVGGSGEVKTALMPLSGGAHALPREEDLVFRQVTRPCWALREDGHVPSLLCGEEVFREVDGLLHLFQAQ